MGRRTKLKVVLLTWLVMIGAAWGCQHLIASVPSVTSCPGYLCEGFTSPDLPGAEVMVCARDQAFVSSFLGLGKAEPSAANARAMPAASALPSAARSRPEQWVSIGPVGLDGQPLDGGAADAKGGP